MPAGHEEAHLTLSGAPYAYVRLRSIGQPDGGVSATAARATRPGLMSAVGTLRSTPGLTSRLWTGTAMRRGAWRGTSGQYCPNRARSGPVQPHRRALTSSRRTRASLGATGDPPLRPPRTPSLFTRERPVVRNHPRPSVRAPKARGGPQASAARHRHAHEVPVRERALLGEVAQLVHEPEAVTADLAGCRQLAPGERVLDAAGVRHLADERAARLPDRERPRPAAVADAVGRELVDGQ